MNPQVYYHLQCYGVIKKKLPTDSLLLVKLASAAQKDMFLFKRLCTQRPFKDNMTRYSVTQSKPAMDVGH